jgi:hypothetical protein
MLVEAMVLAMFSGDVWALVFLALMLKIPLIGLGVALWFAIKRHDEIKPEVVPLRSQMALCGYCGSRITVGYDANLLHEQAHRIGTRTGEAVFDVESRLVRESLRQPNHYASEPRYCPGCGDEAVWTPIEPIDLSATGRPRLGQAG